MEKNITLWGSAISNYVRCVALCCREKGVVYQLQAPDEKLLSLNPFKKIPVMEHDGNVIYETAAICRYIDRVFDGPALSPSDPVLLAWMDQWISAANCYFDSAIIRRYVLEYTFPKGDKGQLREDVIATAETEIKNYLGIMEMGLNEYDCFSGNKLGIADYLIVPMLDYLSNGVVPTNLVAEFPGVENYLTRMLQRESTQQLLGDPRVQP
ncbi:glutathione S-transferase family protein [Pseudomonadota bacterium]